MKKTINILLSVALAILFNSCVIGHDSDDISTRSGILSVDIENDASSLADDAREGITTVRLFIFDNASTNPKLDVNELHTNTAEPGTKVTVKAATSLNTDKMVVAILNEPKQLTSKLASINHPSALEDVAFEFAELFNTNRTAVLAAANGMPMTGVLRHVEVNSSHTDASPKTIPMIVERVVARVDVYLNKDMSRTARLTTATKIRLKKSYDKGYLVTGTEDNGTRFQSSEAENFGHLLTVAPDKLTAVSEWSPTSAISLGSTAQRICYFYTPERSCISDNDADKLRLEFVDITIDGVGMRSAEIILNRMDTAPGGVTDPEDLKLKMIKRNNVYEIYSTVTSNTIDFQAQVLDWADALPVNVDIATPYYLHLSKTESNIYNAIAKDKIVVRTDHPAGWKAELFVDADCTIPLTNNWMTLSAYSGATTVNGSEVIITIGSSALLWERRYIKFTAGRKSLVVRVFHYGDES